MKKSARLIAAGGLAALGLGLLGASAFAHSPKQGMPAGAKAHHTEMRERLLSLDKNQDGMVSQSEINNGRSERFAVIDTDKDGKLSAGEIDESRKAKRLDRINRRLAAMDTDGGGAINHEEFARHRGHMFMRAVHQGMFIPGKGLDLKKIEEMMNSRHKRGGMMSKMSRHHR